jgi:hypothetical protein
MSEEIYMNKNGFKCVRAQLIKTEGRDPQEYEHAKRVATSNGNHDKIVMKAEVAKLKIRVPEFVEDA